MLTLKKFSGINNVLPQERHALGRDGSTPLYEAVNVDINDDGQLLRRDGFTEFKAGCHHNVWEGKGFILATDDMGDLVSIVDGAESVIQDAVSSERMWYVNLPDGRTAFSNGSINGMVSLAGAHRWTPPTPTSLGSWVSMAGGMYPGTYRYCLTYVRVADGREGKPVYSGDVAIGAADGGFALSALPVLTGYRINVYVTGKDGELPYFAGSTATSMFTFTGTNTELMQPCPTFGMQAAPVGTVMAYWNSRVLVAVGSTLYASKPGMHEVFDMRRDFKQFPAPITLIQPVDDGIYIGTEQELGFMQGTEWDGLSYSKKASGRTVLGSGVEVRGELLAKNDGDAPGRPAPGRAMLCIADGIIVAGYNNGYIARMTNDTYRTSVTEVAATARERDGFVQYIAVPQ